MYKGITQKYTLVRLHSLWRKYYPVRRPICMTRIECWRNKCCLECRVIQYTSVHEYVELKRKWSKVPIVIRHFTLFSLKFSVIIILLPPMFSTSFITFSLNKASLFSRSNVFLFHLNFSSKLLHDFL